MLRASDPTKDGWTSRLGSDHVRWSDDSPDRVRKTVSLLARPGLFAVALLVATGGASAQHGSGGMMGGGRYGAFGFPGLGLVFWVLLGLGIVLLVAHVRNSPEHDSPSTDRALETLRERYARGELEDEEFERRRAELERSR
ncbi:SHOCT domain-containing protein [Halorhabdus amylolytica]|uniref:SHOCT domain-containing protein n=1 Tax=Halorhabdus amylolytica TaxID=2559573 RepID=UPI0010AAEC49|nr:SHOCT domain-containing protein [Halorhabdus amylolytica]